MIFKKHSYISLSLFLLTSVLYADTAILKDGKVLQGTFKGGTATAIKFESDGNMVEIPLSNLTTLTFSPREAKPAPAEAAAVPIAAPPKEGPLTIPAGTKLMIKLQEDVGTATHGAGTTIKGMLDNPVVVDGKTVLPAETLLYGKVTEARGGRVLGGIRLVMQFTQISLAGQMIEVSLASVGAEAGRGGAVKKVGAGALVGAAFGGAGEGAAIGGAAAILSARNNHINIPAGTIAEIPLEQPVEIP
jgi:hypothetical protein